MRFARWMAAVAAASLVLAACGGDGTGTDGGASPSPTDGTTDGTTGGDAVEGGNVAMRLEFEPDSLDPHKAASAAGVSMALLLYDRLVNLTPDGEVVSGIAESWEETPTSVTFTLRDDVTCEDGTAITPSIVEQNFERWGDPETAAPYVSTTLGGSEFTTTADDDAGTFTIELPNANSTLLFGLTSQPAIICPAGLETPDQLLNESFGTGAFTLEGTVAGSSYSLASRDGYAWGPDGAGTDVAGFPDTLELLIIENETTASNQLLTGDLDIAGLTGAERERVADEAGLFSTDFQAENFGLFFNHAEGRPGADVEVRRALAQAVSRDELATVAFGQFGSPPPNLLLERAPCQADMTDVITGQDAEAAATALDGVSLKLVIPEPVGGIGELLQQRYTEAGATVDLQVLPANEVVGVLAGGGDWDVTSVGIAANHPTRYFGFFGGPPPPDGANFWRVDSEEYRTAAQGAQAEVGDAACDLWADAERVLHENVHVYPYGIVTVGFFGDGVEFEPANRTGVIATSIRRVAED